MKVSLLVPFRNEPGTTRLQNWEWLAQRWKTLLPEAELVVGTDYGTPFSKTTAVNDSYSRAIGDVFVLADADSWVERPKLIEGIDAAIRLGVLVVPWSQSYRLTPEASEQIITLDTTCLDPVSKEVKESCTDFKPAPVTGAMITILTREAFERVGGMDPRFRGWGSEDVSFVMACGTLLGQTKILLGESFALWHSRPRNPKGIRIWDQDEGFRNRALCRRYQMAYRNPQVMAALCAEHPLEGSKTLVKARPEVQPETPHMVREFAYTIPADGDRIVL